MCCLSYPFLGFQITFDTDDGFNESLLSMTTTGTGFKYFYYFSNCIFSENELVRSLRRQIADLEAELGFFAIICM